MRTALGLLFERDQFAWGIATSAIFVETLLDRGGEGDLTEAEEVTDRMEAAPLEMASECLDLWLLRMRACSPTPAAKRVSTVTIGTAIARLAASLGFEGHMQWAQEMP